MGLDNRETTMALKTNDRSRKTRKAANRKSRRAADKAAAAGR